MAKITVAVPVHGMDNKEFFLKRLLDSLWSQTFQDFDIVVSDNSDDRILGDICDYYKTGITYLQNPRKGMAQNTNEAIKASKGTLIKILYMDDFMAHDKALQRIWDNFSGHWLVTGCSHCVDNYIDNPHKPVYSDDIHLGNNTIGSPSVLTILNQTPLLFDEEMQWLLDCDLYKRYHNLYGEPVILNDINVVIGLHDGQASNLMGDERKLQEKAYIQNKYA